MRFGAFVVVAVCGSLALLPGQSVSDTQDAAKAVHRIAEQVREELSQVDELLLEATRPPDVSDFLMTASDSQGKVATRMQELIDQLHEFCCTCPGGT